MQADRGPRRADDKAPLRVKVVGDILVLVGVVGLIESTAAGGLTRAELVWNLAVECVLIIVGVALLLDVRWAWPLALLIAATAIGMGVTLLAEPVDTTNPGALVFVLWTLFIPGGALLVALATPRSIRWFRGRS